MSNFGKRGSRCDFCGKFTKDDSGAYCAKNGRIRYIMHAEYYDQHDDERDRQMCEDCWDAGHRFVEQGAAL